MLYSTRSKRETKEYPNNTVAIQTKKKIDELLTDNIRLKKGCKGYFFNATNRLEAEIEVTRPSLCKH